MMYRLARRVARRLAGLAQPLSAYTVRNMCAVCTVCAMCTVCVAAGCRSPTATAPSSALALHPDTAVELPGGGATFTLYRVDNDSRCAVDVQCVSAGNAVVVFGVSTCSGCLPAQQFLNTNVDPRSLVVGGLTIRLDSLLPAPHSGQVIAQSDYVAYLTVTRPSSGGY